MSPGFHSDALSILEMHEHGSGSVLQSSVAAYFARAYLRVSQKARHSGVSESVKPNISLDVSTTESPHVDEETGPGRPPWKAA